MPATMSKLASLGLGLAAVAAGAATSECPVGLDLYSSEVNPFGWPLTPADFQHSNPNCWVEKYPRCAGSMQSPMDLDLLDPDASCEVKYGTPGVLASLAEYPALSSQTVMVSKYMRAAAVVGDLGKLNLQNAEGVAVEYVAVGAYLTAGSLHTVNGVAADAELLVVHRPKDAIDEQQGAVVVSMRFVVGVEDSQLFTQMGFTSDDRTGPEGASWQAPSISIQPELDAALHGPVLSYTGSVPMPPCTENVQYLALTETHSVTPKQVDKLKNVLRIVAGGFTKRPPVARKTTRGCRAVKADTPVIPRQEIACPAGSTLPAACWTECAKSPIAVQSASTMQSATNATKMFAYTPTDHVTVSPTTYTLDVAGDFGSLMVQGRLFEATKLSIKAVSQHSVDGVRHAGELIIHHSLFGERFGVAAAAHRRRLSDPHASDPHATDTHASETPAPSDASAGHGDYPPTAADDEVNGNHLTGDEDTELDDEDEMEHGAAEGPHQVMVSIPLKLGRENAFLRTLGLSDPSHRLAISHGNSYSIHESVDLQAELQSPLSKHWYWYNGGPTTPGECPAWGVKWMVFEEPLEVSIQQLNGLMLKVNGIDSTRMPQATPSVWKDSMPKGAVESNGWKSPDPECDTGIAQSPINIITADVNRTGTHNFLAKASWKPLSGLRLMSEDTGLRMETNQMGYFSMVGPDGYPKYYQVTAVDLKMPSEHMIDGKQYPAELQVTHNNQKTVLDFEENDAVITSFLFDFGEESKLLKQLLPFNLPERGSYMTLQQPVDLMWALGAAMEDTYFNYAGSYTTGRCAEVAQWLVFNHTMTLSTEQYQAFKAAFPGPVTNRPVQPLNGRRLMQNVMQEGEPIQIDFFLSRHDGRDRAAPPIAFLSIPIMGTLLLCCTVMLGTFQREDRQRKEQSAGGLDIKGNSHPNASPLGKSYNRF